MRLTHVDAAEILDSRGAPTVSMSVTDGSGRRFVAGVPAGASTGSREAVEVRDGDPDRFGGRGVTTAVRNVQTEIRDLLTSREWSDLQQVDRALCRLDGTPNKSRLGANAIVGVSMAAARAFARDASVPLYRFLSPDDTQPCLPVPHFNVLNGGAHADNGLAFQEFMIAPLGATDYSEGLRWGAEVYAALRSDLRRAGLSSGLGDEGGFAPAIDDPREACGLLVGAVESAGLSVGRDGVCIAIDPAANGFHDGDTYEVAGQRLSSSDLVDLYADLVDAFPIWSIEDGCAEGDDDGWKLLTERLGNSVQIVGDNIFVTDAETIAAAADVGVANAALIKVNQIGTVSETSAALAVCRDRGFAAMISHRSGETPDTFIADLAVASGCGQLKSGAPARGERVSKYNRLLEIAALEPSFGYGSLS